MRHGSSVLRLALLLTFLGCVVSAQADIILDQDNQPFGNVGFNDSLEWQQQVTAGISGRLAGITLYTAGSYETDLDTVKIGIGPAFFTGTYSFETTVAISSNGTFIDTSAANIFLNVGDPFVIDVSKGPGCCHLVGSTVLYPGGHLWLSFDGIMDYTAAYGYTLAFQSYMNTVPEPGTLVLLGTGALGLAGVLRRKINL